MNVSETEMEQFANFMGHTKKTHEEYYRLPQDLFQTAKVSKILIAINKGKGAKYKGKSLDEINLSDIESDDSDNEFEENPNIEHEVMPLKVKHGLNNDLPSCSTKPNPVKKKKPYKKIESEEDSDSCSSSEGIKHFFKV
ncbi:uncharacterized protein LOC111691367 [Anoplophora glabripennis]|uniref:uncharacterized protein LOC111691367 n=1 Tax=Anoplophora glabripennis TaxID=217634 RepID=UPI000C776B88|nr:uncharacterized protein LOC111691367 [Anoplophora glabripennis]